MDMHQPATPTLEENKEKTFNRSPIFVNIYFLPTFFTLGMVAIDIGLFFDYLDLVLSHHIRAMDFF